MEKITIKKIGRKQQPSKFKPGETYTITTIMDEKGRKLVAMGGWSDNWKVDDVIEVEITEKKWTDKDGFEQISLNLTNPNKKAYTGGFTPNPMIVSYTIAAQLAPLFFADSKKKVKLEDIDKLAEEIKKRIITVSNASKEDVPKVDVEKEETANTKDDIDFDEDDDEEKPF